MAVDEAMHRFSVIRPHLEDGGSLAAATRASEVQVRTAQRWLCRYKAEGLDGLKRRHRSDGDRRKLMRLIDGMALRKPRLSCAAIMDDHFRAIAGCLVFLGAPSALQAALALRQAIWRKQNPDWLVCGIPEVL